MHTGKFDRGIYKIIDEAYRIREKCDYRDFFIVSKEDAALQFEHALYFVKEVECFINCTE